MNPRTPSGWMRSSASRRAGAWKDLRGALARLWRWTQKGRDERRVARERARFWAEVREGEREAETRSGS